MEIIRFLAAGPGSGQRENDQGRAFARESAETGHVAAGILHGVADQGAGMQARLADHEGDMLFSVHAVTDRKRSGDIAEVGAPEHFAVGLVEGLERLVDGAAEDEAATGREYRRRGRHELTKTPGQLLRFEIYRLQSADIAVAVGGRHSHNGGAGAEQLGIPSGRPTHHAGLGQRQEEHVALGIHRRREPVTPADGLRADQNGILGVRPRVRIHGFHAGLRVDRGNQVLQSQVDREQVFARGRVKRVVKRHFARGDHGLAGRAVYVDFNDLPLVRPVQIPLVVRHVLEMPRQLAALRPKGNRRIGVQRVVADALYIHRVEQGRGMVGWRRPEIDQVEFRIVASGNPDRASLALRTGDIVPGVSAGIVRPGYRLKTPQFLATAGVYADDESAFGHHRRGDSLDDHAIGEQWRGPQRIAIGAVRANRDGVLPDWFAGAEVQREQSQIKRGHDDGFPVNRYDLSKFGKE